MIVVLRNMLSFILYPFQELIKLYQYGFSMMSKESQTLWVIAVIKLIIMFGILKIFFFRDFLKTEFKNDEQRIEYLQKNFTEIKK
ncbi:DUF4492 domain-containing protein [Chryseobacterium sp.]|uniref:DUF4492 domain-containing protein n=2 Tax=Epilithonimonas pallida TaxID=373671 RepID=A0ABY1R4W3_9FLAO|nr:DUF4492 domain-containing protein [Chryseobacterium sp.]SMP94005.1 protein of unknown function [Epilithonimonas pallida]